ncbi:hypothetical protein KKF70_03955 [bacterium]|nr:hypothetical protein [Candidatus Omnitrophota bacterium]MBU2528527.1 hypothetical protein [bacterium]MBU3929879.1 hypothetical protein [bacterium]MDO9513447.1 hypothetical protein [Elusimicrobiota bacterium]
MRKLKGLLLIRPDEEGTPEAQRAELEYDVAQMLALTTEERFKLLFERSELLERRRGIHNGSTSRGKHNKILKRK